MKKLVAALFLALAVLAPTGCATAPEAGEPVDKTSEARAQDTADFEKASRLIVTERKPQEGLALVEILIERYEARYRNATKRIFSARTMPESLYYAALAGGNRRDSLVLGPIWGYAQFLKGYALVELKRIPEARRALERAIELSPANAQFRSELGHTYQVDKNWSKALEVFTEAERVAKYSNDQERVHHHTRALRGQGFALIEMGRLDEAEARYRRCLELDADDRVAQAELRLIESLRARGRNTLPGRPTPL